MTIVCNDRGFKVSWKITDLEGSSVDFSKADAELFLCGPIRKKLDFEIVDNTTLKTTIEAGLPIGTYTLILDWTDPVLGDRVHSIKENAFGITDVPKEENIPINFSKEIINGWDDNEQGWMTGKYKIADCTYIRIELKKEGKVIIKASKVSEGEYPKVLISHTEGPVFVFRFAGKAIGRYIQIGCSEEPESIKATDTLTKADEQYCKVSTNYIFLSNKVNSCNWFSVFSNMVWEINL